MAEPPTPVYVDTVPLLAALLAHLRSQPSVAVDTEFISEGVYEPALCLLQLATPEGIWLVDPLALPDLGELWQLLTDPERELVATAAREEIRFCLRFAGRPPARLFDPQVAAGLVGFGYPLSHTNLVRRVLDAAVDGSEGFTDWKRRPLAPRQLAYAADDVRHQLSLRARLRQEAEARGRTAWIEDECRELVARVSAGEDEERWRRVSGASGLSRRELAVLRELWRWRDGLARRRNLPHRRVMRDELLVEIARRRPATPEDLLALRSLDRGSLRDEIRAIVDAVRAGVSIREADLPRGRRRADPPQVATLAQLLAVVTGDLAAGCDVEASLLATAADLQEVVRWRLGLTPEESVPAALQGWRGQLLRQPLLGILDGREAVRVVDLNSRNPLRVEP